MKKLEEYSQEVAKWLDPVIGDGAEFTKHDLLKLYAICMTAALESERLSNTYKFSDAAYNLNIKTFEGYPEFNEDNREDNAWDAWWASHFSWDEWTAFAAWCRDMINALPSPTF